MDIAALADEPQRFKNCQLLPGLNFILRFFRGITQRLPPGLSLEIRQPLAKGIRACSGHLLQGRWYPGKFFYRKSEVLATLWQIFHSEYDRSFQIAHSVCVRGLPMSSDHLSWYYLPFGAIGRMDMGKHNIHLTEGCPVNTKQATFLQYLSRT